MEELHPRGDSSSSRRSTPRDAERERWRSFILGVILHPRGDRHRETPRKRDGGASSSGRSTPRDAERFIAGSSRRERDEDKFMHMRRGGVEDSEIDEERTSSIITEASGRATETRRHHRRLITEASRRARDTRRHHRRLLTEPSRRDRFRREEEKIEGGVVERDTEETLVFREREREIEKGTQTRIMPTRDSNGEYTFGDALPPLATNHAFNIIANASKDKLLGNEVLFAN
ncbi:hypothetical protein YC2023_115202 [Brassica napus]